MFDSIFDEVITLVGFGVEADDGRDLEFFEDGQIVFGSEKNILD